MARKSHATPDLIYQLKVTLLDTDPPIWRRFQVISDTTLGRLHDILQIVMGWENDHLHDFTIGKRNYGVPDDSLTVFGMPIVDEDIPTLRSLFPSAGKRFIYQYDFGDSWYHEIEIERIVPAEDGVRYPRCLEGERACPPEDSGGIWGFYQKLEILEDPKDPEYPDVAEWMGDYKPEDFDLNDVNRLLRGFQV